MRNNPSFVRAYTEGQRLKKGMKGKWVGIHGSKKFATLTSAGGEIHLCPIEIRRAIGLLSIAHEAMTGELP